MQPEITTGSILRWGKVITNHYPHYLPHRYLVVGDIYWRGQRKVHCLHLETETLHELSPTEMEIVNED